MRREHTMGRRTAGWMLTMLLGVATAATAATDAELTKAVERRLADEEVVGFNVAVETRGAEVTLRGEVPSLWHREWAMEEARKTKDVVSVVSYLTIRDAESLEALATEVARAIQHYEYYTVFDYVTGSIAGDVVSLHGVVTATPDKPGDLRERVSRVPGVKGVVLDLDVLHPGIGDRRIRTALARGIYGNPAFDRYLGIDPGIHLIVKNGYVTMKGTVLTQGDKIQAESIARRTFGVIRVDNQLKTKAERETERAL